MGKPASITEAVGVAIGLIGTGIVVLFPDKRWLGWVFIIAGFLVVLITLLWTWARRSKIRELGHSEVPPIQIVNSPVFNNTPQIFQQPIATQSQSQSQVQAQGIHGPTKPEPNLVLKQILYFAAHQPLQNNLLFEGAQQHRYDLRPDSIVHVLEICNEFSPSQLVVSVENVTAQIFYKAQNGDTIQMNRGAWLSKGNRVSFGVNDTRYLIIAGSPVVDPATHAPCVWVLVKEFARSGVQMIDSLTRILKGDRYLVEVRLISESRGILYQTFNFYLTITREPEFFFMLHENRELTLAETQEQLEKFLNEGKELLKQCEELTSEFKKDQIDDWESRVTWFLDGQNRSAYKIRFMSNAQIVQHHKGLATDAHRRLLDRINTRIARLEEMIVELDKAK